MGNRSKAKVMGQVDVTKSRGKRTHKLQAVVVKGLKRPMPDYKSLVALGGGMT